MNDRPTGCRRFVALLFSGFWWALLGGILAVIAVPSLIFVCCWVTGSGATGYPLRGPGPSVTPLSPSAAKNALTNAVVIGALGALPVFAIGSFLGVIVGFARGARNG